MPNKFYVKDGIGMEGITMQEGKSRLPKILSTLFITVVLLALFGFGVSRYVADDANQDNDQLPLVTVLPTSAREPEPTEEPVVSQSPTSSPTQRVSPSPTRKVTPSPTEKAAAPLTIQVLNGSGEQGVAAKMRTALTGTRYQVTSTGNADAFTYEGLTVRIKNSKKQFLDQLKKDLSAKGYLITESVTTLSETAATDIVLIVGSE